MGRCVLAAGKTAGPDFVRARDEADPAGRFTNPYLNRVLGPPPGTGSPTDGPG
jgi:hypothetical protein